MSAMIQIRNVPDEVHRELKVRAARQGLTLSAFLLREVTRVARGPSWEEVFAELDRDGAVELTETPAEAVRAERGALP